MSKKNTKIISLLLSFTIIASLITFKNINVKAEISDRPDFDVEIDSATPNPALVGEDITISGTITPKPFETAVPAKEIVLVLDVSNSMREEIKINEELCDEQRIRYCTTHGSSGRHDESRHSKHNWVDDYCEKHMKGGIHYNTRIDKLKEAANNFIDEMESVPNLKIGIVTYGTYGKINRVNLNHEEIALIASSEVNLLKGIINDIYISGGQDGGTNTGDGLRRATYLLDNSSESNKNANKTIVLMSDGMPTYHLDELDSGKYKYYKDISKEGLGEYWGAKLDGSGNSDRDLENTNYAIEIGKIIDTNGYNIFSVGYGLSNEIETEEKLSSLDKIKLIHGSMIGSNIQDNKIINGTVINEENGFYETDEGAIDSVFQQIATEIINSYQVNNVALNMELNEYFTLNIDGDAINIGTVNDLMVPDVQSDNKIRYEADPVPFEFTIRGNEDGNHLVFKDLDLTYSWNGKTEKKELESNLRISIINELPYISAELISDKNIKGNIGDEITLNYKITPNSFLSSDLSSGKKEIEEVIIIADLPEAMKSAQRFSFLQNGITNQILNDGTRFSNTKFGFIGYNEYYYVGDRNNIDDPKAVSMKENVSTRNLIKPLFDINDSNSKDGFRRLFQENIINYSSDKRNLDAALNTAKEVFDNYGDNSKGKAIVLINSGDVNYSQEVASIIKNKGYKIISLDISNDINTNLKTLHEDLGGVYDNVESESDYLIGTLDGGNYNAVDTDMKKVADRIAGGIITDKYNEIFPKLYFDLNNNFDYVEDSNSNVNVIRNEDNKLELNLINPIKYEHKGNMESDKYKYEAEPQNISFRVKVKDSNSSIMAFGNNNVSLVNYLSYLNFISREVNVPLETPIFTKNVRPQVRSLTHGLYSGIENNSLVIDNSLSNSGFEIAANSTITYGASFILSGKEVDFTLNLDSKFTPISSSEIKAYVVDGARLIDEGVSISNTSEANVFRVSINDSKASSAERQVLLIYKRRMVETAGENNDTFTNEIRVDNLSKPVTVRLYNPDNSKPKLPDLF